MVTIANSVTSIGRNAFAGLNQLAVVLFYGSEEEWDAIEIAEGNLNLDLANITFLTPGSDPEPSPVPTTSPAPVPVSTPESTPYVPDLNDPTPPLAAYILKSGDLPKLEAVRVLRSLVGDPIPE